MSDEIETVEGVIMKVDYGYGLKYADVSNIYLQFVIQMFDGYICIQLFREEKLRDILAMFGTNHRDKISLNTLLFQKVCLLKSSQTNGVPDAISFMGYDGNSKWIFNNNWD